MDIVFPKGTGGFLNPEIVVQGFGLQKGMKVADFGCGAGYFTIPMAKLVGDQGRITAIDILEEQLSAVRNRASTFGLKNIDYIRGDLEKLQGSKLDDVSQDAVLIANLLFQVENKKVPLEEAKRVLKSGGKLIVIDWREDSMFGPKDGRVDKEKVKKVVESYGFTFIEDLTCDTYHWGMAFRK